jgi:hypothetical protein
MSRLGHLQSSLSRPSDWKTTTGQCTSMLIQNMAAVVVFELHRTCSRSMSSCIGHGFPLVLLTQIEAQKIVVGMFKTVANKGESEFQSIHKPDSNFTSSIEDLEYNLTICKRHADAVANLCISDSRGYKLGANCVPPKPYFLIGSVSVVDKSFMEIEHCVFCGLGFAPVWALMFSTCKHLYHH